MVGWDVKMTTKARPVRKLLADAEEKILAIRDDEVQIPAHKLVLASVMQHLLHVNLEDKCAQSSSPVPQWTQL